MSEHADQLGDRVDGAASSLVDWQLAERVAVQVAGRSPGPPGYRANELEKDFAELTSLAEDLVAEATGLRSSAGAARARVTDRAGWVRANVASVQRLLTPTLAKIERRKAEQGSSLPFSLPRPMAGVGRSASGLQLGLLLAWVSTRVLGQYDLLLTDDHADDQDLVYYVGPNVVSLETRYGFPPRQFRLWLAMHEVTHRCQFTAVPWLRDHFLTLVDRGLEPVAADPRRLAEALRRALGELRSRRSPVPEHGIVGLVATPEQLEAIEAIQALMSLLEGHGDVTMDRAGASQVPGARRFAQVLRERRQQVWGPARFLQRLLGIEAKMRQYAEGEHFVTFVEAAGGTGLLQRVWQGPAMLPSLTEIRDPAAWVARVGGAAAASA